MSSSVKSSEKSLLTILGFMLFFIQGDSFATSPLLIKISEEFNISVSIAGLSAVLYMIPFGLFTLLFGPLGDKFGKLKLITIAAFGTTIFSALSGIAPSFSVLCVFRALNGIFAAAVMPVTMALIGEISNNDSQKLHQSLSKVMGLMFLGGATAPFIGGAIAHFGSWRSVYLFYGFSELLITILIVAKVRVKTVKNSSVTFKSTYKDSFKNRRLIALVTIMSVIGFTLLGSFTYLGKYVASNTELTILSVGLILSLYGVGSMLGGRVAPKLHSKLNINGFVIASFIGISSMLAMAFIPNIYVLSIGSLGMGLTFTLIQPKLIALAQGLHPKNRGTVMSLASFNMSFGAGFGALFFGFVIKLFSLNLVYFIAAFILLLLPLLTIKFANNR